MAEKRTETMRWSIPVSLLLHAAILAAFLVFAPVSPPDTHRDDGISVELVRLPLPHQPVIIEEKTWPIATLQKQPSLTAEKIIEAARNRPVSHTAPKQATRPNALIVARQLYSGSLLADRHNKSAREAMKTLAVDERIIQLCNIEAMEQVRRAQAKLKPDYVVAYAMADLKLSDHAVDAEGGAFFSHRNWYGLKFRCDVSPDDSKVISFAFLVGQPIPKAQWARHNLTSDASSSD